MKLIEVYGSEYKIFLLDMVNFVLHQSFKSNDLAYLLIEILGVMLLSACWSCLIINGSFMCECRNVATNFKQLMCILLLCVFTLIVSLLLQQTLFYPWKEGNLFVNVHVHL